MRIHPDPDTIVNILCSSQLYSIQQTVYYTNNPRFLPTALKIGSEASCPALFKKGSSFSFCLRTKQDYDLHPELPDFTQINI
jgi:hypothetical protein